MRSFTTFSALLLATAPSLRSVQAHTTFTNFYVDGAPQGDGTCVRMSNNIQQATFPISSITSDDMACGVNGETGVARVCPVTAGSTFTLEYREVPDNAAVGSLDISHKGTCAVYMKSVTSAMASNNAGGDGWFKIFWEDYDTTAGKWCTEKIMANQGHLSVTIPSELPAGYYLVRSELLALHQADKTPPDPQFYVGCAQIALTSTSSTLPPSSDTVSIPGYVNMQQNNAAMTFNIWITPLKLPYPAFGPPVWPGSSNSKRDVEARGAFVQTEGLVPAGCVLQNVNWCGIELPTYSDEAGCWDASKNCWAQATTCYNSAGPTGSKNCPIWEAKCKGVQDACNAGNFNGPPNAGQILTPALYKPASLPPPSAYAGTNTNPAASPAASAGPMYTPIITGTGSIDSCGTNRGMKCASGMCCSAHGFCGTTSDYCGAGCQPDFGTCSTSNGSSWKRRHLRKHVHGAHS